MIDTFTVQKAISIQQDDLKRWRHVLKDDCWYQLAAWAQAHNDSETNPYNIRRGLMLDEYVRNSIMPPHYPT